MTDTSPPERPLDAFNDNVYRWVEGQPLPHGLWLVQAGKGKNPRVFRPTLLRPSTATEATGYHSHSGWQIMGYVKPINIGWRKGQWQVVIYDKPIIYSETYFSDESAAIRFLVIVGEHFYAPQG